tara:strand:- start:73 stop:870 length:798 start_codon:yes stop_codon:yes gene_type:complete
MALVPLSKANHSDLKILPVDLKNFSELSLIPIYFHEINWLACEYPLCFIVNDGTVDFRLISTVSEEQGSALIKEDGNWVGRYVPSYLRHYPFFAFSDESEKSTIFIEDESPRLSFSDGVPLFNNSEPTEILDQIVADLRTILGSAKKTQVILEALKAFNLIRPWEPKIKTSSDQEILLSGVYRIDETALNELSSDAWNELREISAFPMIYGQLFSTHNITKLIMYQNLKLKLSSKENLDVVLDSDGQTVNFELASEDAELDFDNI